GEGPDVAIGRAADVTLRACHQHDGFGAGDSAQLLPAAVGPRAGGQPFFAVVAVRDGTLRAGLARDQEGAAHRGHELDAAVVEVEAELAAHFPALAVAGNARRVAAGNEQRVAVRHVGKGRRLSHHVRPRLAVTRALQLARVPPAPRGNEHARTEGQATP